MKVQPDTLRELHEFWQTYLAMSFSLQERAAPALWAMQHLGDLLDDLDAANARASELLELLSNVLDDSRDTHADYAKAINAPHLVHCLALVAAERALAQHRGEEGR